jgi:hypothetical protein
MAASSPGYNVIAAGIVLGLDNGGRPACASSQQIQLSACIAPGVTLAGYQRPSADPKSRVLNCHPPACVECAVDECWELPFFPKEIFRGCKMRGLNPGWEKIDTTSLGLSWRSSF